MNKKTSKILYLFYLNSPIHHKLDPVADRVMQQLQLRWMFYVLHVISVNMWAEL